ncbi:MAG: NADP-dependent malic enzyme [Oscillospiraceae bacterium]
MNIKEQALKCHEQWQGKIEVTSRVKVDTKEMLSLAYTPGVAEPCLKIHENPELSYELTRRSNLVAVITDGTAVLGLGDIGPEAGMPVMEGKCALFKCFAGVDAFPICLDTKDTDEIVRTVEIIAKSFGGINLEDISAPRCFEIERRLKEKLDIPVFHDDQHGTAIVVGAALLNALKVAKKSIDSVKIVINGAGSAGMAIGKLILNMGCKDLTMVDRDGIICKGVNDNTEARREIAELTNLSRIQGGLDRAIENADVFIGVSAPDVLKPEMIKSMAEKPIVFAMANPTPEIMPDEAKRAGAFIVGTGRSDFPNQINNVLAFPGVFKGALAVRAKEITEEMKMASAKAIAAIITDDELNTENIIPNPFDERVADAVAKAVADTARAQGIARI